MPTVTRDEVNAAEAWIAEQLRRDWNHSTVRLCNMVINNPDFKKWSGSAHSEHHHYGDGGLYVHTIQVAAICLLNNQMFGIPNDLLLIAALWHDVGKIKDYARNEYGVWHSTTHRHRIHHIFDSAAQFKTHATGVLPDDEVEQVVHAILAHHGRREWGSPVEPQSRLAWLLHLADCISARMHDTPLVV